MKDEIKRILMMVQEGKISADDAAELIDAFTSAREEEAAEAAGSGASTGASSGARGYYEPTAGKDPFRAFVETMERFGREATQSVDWPEVTRQIRTSAQQGLDALKHGLETVGRGAGFNLFGNTEVREFTLPLSLPADSTLRIENSVGQVKVVGGFDHGTVLARAWFHGATPEETKRKADEWTLLVEGSERGTLIRQQDLANVTVDLEVQLSGTSRIEVQTESGDVTLLDCGSSAEVMARSGDVRLRGLNGAIEVHVVSGDVELEDCVGPSVNVENKSGDMKLVRVGGNTSAKTISGDIHLEDGHCPSLSIETVSGDVEASLTNPVDGAVNVRTVSGDARVVLGAGGDVRVSLSSLRGDIDCDLNLLDEVRTDQRLTGRIGTGRGTLDVSAVTGDVELRMPRAQIREE
jgi:DUF4097 and DUF4098 domain-containing protein YvlB